MIFHTLTRVNYTPAGPGRSSVLESRHCEPVSKDGSKVHDSSTALFIAGDKLVSGDIDRNGVDARTAGYRKKPRVSDRLVA